MTAYWYWLSFVCPDHSRFLGACIVRGEGDTKDDAFISAVRNAHRLGCNPGGECQGARAPDDMPEPPPAIVNRLYTTKAEAQAAAEVWEGPEQRKRRTKRRGRGGKGKRARE